jgi:hypothetical protein
VTGEPTIVRSLAALVEEAKARACHPSGLGDVRGFPSLCACCLADGERGLGLSEISRRSFSAKAA